MLVSCVGSLSDRHHDRAYHQLTLDGEKLHVEVRRYASLENRFRRWVDAPWCGKYRLPWLP